MFRNVGSFSALKDVIPSFMEVGAFLAMAIDFVATVQKFLLVAQRPCMSYP